MKIIMDWKEYWISKIFLFNWVVCGAWYVNYGAHQINSWINHMNEDTAHPRVKGHNQLVIHL